MQAPRFHLPRQFRALYVEEIRSILKGIYEDDELSTSKMEAWNYRLDELNFIAMSILLVSTGWICRRFYKTKNKKRDQAKFNCIYEYILFATRVIAIGGTLRSISTLLHSYMQLSDVTHGDKTNEIGLSYDDKSHHRFPQRNDLTILVYSRWNGNNMSLEKYWWNTRHFEGLKMGVSWACHG